MSMESWAWEEARRGLTEYRNEPSRANRFAGSPRSRYFAVVVIHHLLESNHREEISGLGLLKSDEAEVVLKSTESTEGEVRIGFVFWATLLGMVGVTTMISQVCGGEEVRFDWDS